MKIKSSHNHIEETINEMVEMIHKFYESSSIERSEKTRETRVPSMRPKKGPVSTRSTPFIASQSAIPLATTTPLPPQPTARPSHQIIKPPQIISTSFDLEDNNDGGTSELRPMPDHCQLQSTN